MFVIGSELTLWDMNRIIPHVCGRYSIGGYRQRGKDARMAIFRNTPKRIKMCAGKNCAPSSAVESSGTHVEKTWKNKFENVYFLSCSPEKKNEKPVITCLSEQTHVLFREYVCDNEIARGKLIYTFSDVVQPCDRNVLEAYWTKSPGFGTRQA